MHARFLKSASLTLLTGLFMAGCATTSTPSSDAPTNAAQSASSTHTDGNVTKATLDNGLRVVIVRDSLAPVVTTQMNYLVGGDETAEGFPGSAHALEHMMFRGSPGLSKDQLMAIAANMGGAYNAATTAGVTRYFFTAPADDLDVALHVAATRMRGINITKEGWDKERGAIEQEVSRDMSNPFFKFQTQLLAHMFAGTPYASTPLGTRDSFNNTTAEQLRKFHDAWYAPNNAILVISGDVQPQAALAQVKGLFGEIPRKNLPARPEFNFQPVTAKTIKLPTDFPFGVVALAWRMPGLRDADYATAQVLADALGSKRGKLFGMRMTGKALFGQFAGAFKPQAGIGYALAGFRRGGDSQQVLGHVQDIIANVASNGVPADLVKAAKKKAIADLEYKKNSVSGLANAWSHALAFRGGTSPDDIRDDIAAVTPEQVNQLAKRIFNPDHAITAVLTPTSSGKPSMGGKGFGGAETFDSKPSAEVTLPDWAKASFKQLSLPKFRTNPSSFTLDNGLRVIVQPESVSKTVEVYGRIDTNSDLQAPKGKKGVGQILNAMFAFGSADLNRLQFQAALDEISAHESAGSSFSLKVPSQHFEAGLKLLAANELQPNLPQRAFMVMKRNVKGAVAGRVKSPDFLNTLHLNKALYPADDPVQRHATPDSVAEVTLDDVKAYHDKVFRPDMTTIVVIGDVTAEQAHAAIAKAFGDWQASGPKPDTAYPAVPANEAGRLHTPDSSAVQDSVTLSQTIAMNQNSPDRYALSLGNQILGGGFHGHLMQDLRSKAGLVYGVYSRVSLQKHRGTFSVHFGSDPDKVGEARAMVIRDVKQMQTTPVTADELHSAKGKMLRRLAVSKSSFGAIAGNFLSLALQDKPLDADSIAARKYLHMEADAIQAMFNKYVRPDGFVTAVKGPKPTD